MQRLHILCKSIWKQGQQSIGGRYADEAYKKLITSVERRSKVVGGDLDKAGHASAEKGKHGGDHCQGAASTNVTIVRLELFRIRAAVDIVERGSFTVWRSGGLNARSKQKHGQDDQHG